MAITSNFNDLLNRVQEQLQSSIFQRQSYNFDRRPLIEAANSLGGPVMKLLHWQRIVELGRIPRSEEEQAGDAMEGIERFGAPQVEIIMISHRWLRPSLDPSLAHPDSEDHQKAKAINEFSNWRRQWVQQQHGFLPEIYYWIDFACIDQNDTVVSVPMLPLWVACCERFLRIESEGYDSRAWCRLEPLLSHVYAFADHHVSIDLEFKSNWPDTGTETTVPILDPTEAATTLFEDQQLIARLTEMATSANQKVEFGQTMIKCFKL